MNTAASWHGSFSVRAWSQVVHVADSLAPYFAAERVLDVARPATDRRVI
jgi:hypothetical protein